MARPGLVANKAYKSSYRPACLACSLVIHASASDLPPAAFISEHLAPKPRRRGVLVARMREGRGGLFVIIGAAEHPPGGRVHVVHLAASDALDREKGSIVARRFIGSPRLNAEVLVWAAEKEHRHLE